MDEILNLLKQEYDNYIELLAKLVNVDCGSKNIEGVNEVANIIASQFNILGSNYSIEVIKQEGCGNHLCITRKGTVPGKIMLIGHMDTVFPVGTVKERPFRIDEVNAYGPGVEDMKSGITSIYFALKALDKMNADNLKTIEIVFNSDEELSSIYSRGLIEERAKDADCAIVLESGLINEVLYTGRKGVGKYKLKTYGKASHAGGNPQEGRNAIYEMADKILKLEQLTNYDLGTTVNVGVISGGTAANVVPDYCEALIDVRITKKDEGDIIDKKIRDIVASTHINGTHSELEGSIMRPPMERTDANLKLFEMAKEVGKRIGMNLSEKTTGGGY